MNYSDSIKAILLAAINDLSKTPEKYAVKPGVDFIRNRNFNLGLERNVIRRCRSKRQGYQRNALKKGFTPTGYKYL